jgi:hypothetical protein
MLTRSVEPIYGISATQDPYQIFVGGLETSGTLTFVMETDAELTRYLTNTQPAITVDWQNGSGASATQISATITKGAYVAAAIDRGKDHVEISVDVTGLANTTDAGSTGGYAPIKWTLKNAVAANIYQ